VSKKKNIELGRGIRALLGNIEDESLDTLQSEDSSKSSSPTGGVMAININMVEVNPFQPRKEFDPEALLELSESIKTYGLIQPITVRKLNDHTYQLISGERRLRASKMAGLTEIPAYIRIADDQGMLEMALVENIQRHDLNAIEIAISYQRLVEECNITHEDLSERVGKKRSTITNYLRLLRLSPEIQQAIKNEAISMGHARALLAIDDIAVRLMLFKQIVDKGLSVRAIEDMAKTLVQGKSISDKKQLSYLPDTYKVVQDSLSQLIGSKVQVKVAEKGKGQIVIHFNSDNELNRILDSLNA